MSKQESGRNRVARIRPAEDYLVVVQAAREKGITDLE
jgi:hypothetical protein